MMAGKIVPVGGRIDRPADLQTNSGDPRMDRTSRAPTMMLASSLSGRPLPFGSSLELELRGGDRLGPGGIVCDLELEWEPELMNAVGEACANQRIRGRDWFTMPPMALGGPAGAGRTHMARRLARAAGVPHIMFDATTWMFTWRCSGPDVRLPLPIATAMAVSGCANPVVSVTGVQQASPAMIDLLVRLIDPTRNGSFIDEALGAVVDYSAVNWVVQVPPPVNTAAHRPTNFFREQDATPAEIPDRLKPHLLHVALQDAEPAHFELLVIDVLAEVLGDLGQALPPSIDLEVIFAQLGQLRDPSMLELYDRLEQTVRRHSDEHPL